MKPIASLLLLPVLAGAAATKAEPTGREVFDHYCVQCHGDSREAVGTQQLARTRGADKALLEERKDLNASYISQVVRHGLRAMPPFAPADLNDARLQALITYLVE